MPERIEIQLMIEELNRRYKNKILKKLSICSGRYTKHGAPTLYNSFVKYLPLKIKQFNVKGKFIWITFHNSSWIIYVTLGLTGHFKYEGNAKYCRYQFITNKSTFCMDDMRNFGTLSFIDDPSKLEKKLNSIGSDVFIKSFTLSNLRCIINSIVDKKKDMMIGIFLLEQKYISGIGNYLRSDILYDASISPFRSLTSLSDDNIKILHKSIHKIVKKSYKIQKKNGLHSYPFLVYKQKKTKNMENVSHDMIGKRFIYWVPSKQK